MRSFFDTNVLVYLFDSETPGKKKKAEALLAAEVKNGNALISTQVLQEFYVSVTRKLAKPLPRKEAYEALLHLSKLPLVTVDASLILESARLVEKRSISFWDALIVCSALRGGSVRIYSEDMQDGEKFNGLKIENPLK